MLISQPLIFGELQDSKGHGLAGYTLVAREETTRKHIDTAVARFGGRFTLTVEPGKRYSVLVRKPGDWRGFPLLVEPGLEASSESIRLQLPREEVDTATVRFRAMTPEGTPLQGAQVDLWHNELKIWRTLEATADSASFELTGLAPGHIDLTLRHVDHPVKSMDTLELEAGEMRDLGDLRFEPSGRVAGEFVGAIEEAQLSTLAVHIGRVGGGYGVLERTGASFKSSPLAPGEHTLSFVGDFLLPVYERVEVLAGETLELEIKLVPAGLRRIRIQTREGDAAPTWVGAHALDSGGRVIWSGGAKPLEEGGFEARVSVLPGTYSFEATDDLGRKASCNFDVLDMRGKQPALELQLGSEPR